MMFFSSNTFRFVLVLAAACNAVTSAGQGLRRVQDTEIQPPAVELGTADNYVILTKAGISTVPDSDITGDIAVSPIAATAMTGFGLTMDLEGEFSDSIQLTGKAYAADYGGVIPLNLTTAVGNMETAYTDAEGRSSSDPTKINYGSGGLGGVFGGEQDKLTAGIYTFGSDVSINEDIYFDAGDAGEDAIFIIKISGNLVQAANKKVLLTNGTLAKNIFWQVAKVVNVGAGAHMEGIILGKTNVLLETGSSLTGRVLAQTVCDLQKATISA
jgi:hypothetical protein